MDIRSKDEFVYFMQRACEDTSNDEAVLRRHMCVRGSGFLCGEMEEAFRKTHCFLPPGLRGGRFLFVVLFGGLVPNLEGRVDAKP